MADNTVTGSMDFETVTVGGDEALAVAKDQGGGGKTDAEAYVFAPDVTSGGVNPFWRNWNAGGGFSSYDVQVKVATGDVDSADLTASVPSYACGPVFRGYAVTGQKQIFLGISLVRDNSSLTPPGAQTADPWANNTDYEEGDTVESDNAIYECIQAHTSKNKTKPPDPAYWKTISAAYVVLWIRGSNKWNGDGEWLAYKMVDETSGIVGVDGEMSDWTTLVARVVEAASIKLDTLTTTVTAGDTVTGAAGSALVVSTINDSDGKVVLLLNNLSDDFEKPVSVDGSAMLEYSERDNYIWAFYADETDHSSNDVPIDDTRLGQERGDIAWPMTAIQDWSAADDRFTLVDWNSPDNPAYEDDIYIMGTGNEANAIIRFSAPYKGDDPSTRPGPYETGAVFPEEIGVVALGGEGTIFFDDFAVRISSAGGLPGSGSTVVSP